jgi:hypothetical protein
VTRDAVEEARLTGAIRANETDDRTWLDNEAHFFEYMHPTE